MNLLDSLFGPAYALSFSPGRGKVHVAAFASVIFALAACGSESTSTSGSGGGGGATSASTTTGTPASPCEAYCAAEAACVDDPACVTDCEAGTAAPCEAEWDGYTTCLAQNFDAVSCKWQFHACEAEATAVGDCLGDTTLCLTQCDADGADGCACTHACVGTDFAWTCAPANGGGYTCACSHDGVDTGTCTDQGQGSCEVGNLVMPCCMQL